MPKIENQRASVVFTCVCAAGILPVQGLTGYRMLHPIIGGAVLVWSDPGLLTWLPGQGSYCSIQFTLAGQCLPLVHLRRLPVLTSSDGLSTQALLDIYFCSVDTAFSCGCFLRVILAPLRCHTGCHFLSTVLSLLRYFSSASARTLWLAHDLQTGFSACIHCPRPFSYHSDCLEMLVMTLFRPRGWR